MRPAAGRLRRRISPPAIPDRFRRSQPPSRYDCQSSTQRAACEGNAERWQVDSGSVWEPIAGYSRAVRAGERILVSGTTATHGSGEVVCPGDAAGQTVFILDKIAASLAALGGKLEDVVRTRIYLKDADNGRRSRASTAAISVTSVPRIRLIEISRLVGDYEVEIEAEAVVEPGSSQNEAGA